MNIHQCIFKILGKNQSVTDGHADGQHENSIPHHKQSLRGYNNVALTLALDSVHFSTKQYRYFSYFFTITFAVGTHLDTYELC